jgi:hypothetical protein
MLYMFFNFQVLKSSEALMDNIRDEVLKVNKVELVDDFTGTMILTCSVLAKAFTEKVPVLQVLDTLSSRHSFLSPYVEPEGLKPEERLTVAGEEINQNDLDSLKCTSWLNDKVKSFCCRFKYYTGFSNCRLGEAYCQTKCFLGIMSNKVYTMCLDH